MATYTFKGGDKLKARLAELSKKVSKSSIVDVGFFEGSTESASGVSTPMVAYCNEFGVEIPNESGEPKEDKEYRTPPRPFFRGMIKDGEKHWGDDLGKALLHADYDSSVALSLMGESMTGELVQSITDQVYQPLAKSTVQKKGFDTTLLDTGDMKRAAAFEVKE